MKRKKRLLFVGSIAITSMVFAAVLFTNAQQYTFTQGGIQTYGVSFNSSKNKFHQYTGNTAYSGETTIKTDLGNDIGFSYYQVKGLTNTWHVLGSEGYFYNTDPIHGLDRITLSFKTNNANFDILYSYDDSFDQSQSFISSTANNITFDFNGYQPNYFKVVNRSGSNFNIASIGVVLSCVNNYPNVSVFSENTTMGTVSGGGIMNAGQQVTINAAPNSGYRFVGWYDEHNDLVSENNPYKFIIGNEDLVYIAKFTYESYTFVVESESNEKGTVSDSSGSYNYQENVTISATSNDGYTFSGWYEGNNLISTDNPYTFPMPYENTTYIAKFSTNSYQLTLINDNEELGSISGEGMYQYGSNATATATPNTGVSFLGWYNEQDELIAVSNPYVFTMPYEDVTLTAKFAWTPYSVEVSINDEDMGSVTGTGSYTYGQQVNLVATPAEHHSFFGWYINDEFYSRETRLTFNMPAVNLVYEARFTKNYSLNVYSDDESMGTVTAPTEWGAGLEVTVTANAKEGYAIDYWYDDDLNEISYDFSYKFVMPKNDVNLYAAFDFGYELTVISNDELKGTVSGGGRYKAGRNVTIRAKVADSVFDLFSGWFDENDVLVSNCDNFTFIMPEANTLYLAKFDDIAYDVNDLLSDDGTICPQENGYFSDQKVIVKGILKEVTYIANYGTYSGVLQDLEDATKTIKFTGVKLAAEVATDVAQNDVVILEHYLQYYHNEYSLYYQKDSYGHYDYGDFLKIIVAHTSAFSIN